MKRASQEVAGGPRLRALRPQVAGRPVRSTTMQVATVPVWAGPAASKLVIEEAGLLADFADFMSGEEEQGQGVLQSQDATFKEQLRRRLWRSFVTAHLRGGKETSH